MSINSYYLFSTQGWCVKYHRVLMLDTSEITLVNSTDVFVLVCFAKLSGKFYQSTYNIQLHADYAARFSWPTYGNAWDVLIFKNATERRSLRYSMCISAFVGGISLWRPQLNNILLRLRTAYAWHGWQWKPALNLNDGNHSFQEPSKVFRSANKDFRHIMYSKARE